MLLTRCSVTVQSFKWSDRTKVSDTAAVDKVAILTSNYMLDVRNGLHVHAQVYICTL